MPRPLPLELRLCSASSLRHSRLVRLRHLPIVFSLSRSCLIPLRSRLVSGSRRRNVSSASSRSPLSFRTSARLRRFSEISGFSGPSLEPPSPLSPLFSPADPSRPSISRVFLSQDRHHPRRRASPSRRPPVHHARQPAHRGHLGSCLPGDVPERSWTSAERDGFGDVVGLSEGRSR